MNHPFVIALLVLVAVLVCWALAEMRIEGWNKRKRRIVLLLALAIAAQVVAWRITKGG